MAGSVSAEVWLNQRRWDALEESLKTQGSNIERHLQDYLIKLYNETVPFDQWLQIENAITKEELESAQAAEDQKVYAAFHIREHGHDSIFSTGNGEEFLDVAIRLRHYVRGGASAVRGDFSHHFYKTQSITRERFDELAALRLENTGKVTGAFEIDLDAGWCSALNLADGWQTFKIKDVSTAAYGLSYPEAMIRLLGGEQGVVYEASPRKEEPEPKEFALPPAGESMRRVYAYLLKQRFISREVLNTFVSQRLIYESCEKSKDNTKEYHNAVFVGFDEHGVPRHAHKRGVYTHGKSYRGNVSGCDPRYSFHWTGSSDRLYVFEAPIDLLSFLTLYPQDWQKHSYVALCGTSEHAMLWMLEQNPQIRKVALCLDHDEAGIEASGQHEDTLRERGIAAAPLRSQYKDWNADLKALHGLPAEPAEEHPQLLAADPICQRIGAAVSSGVAKPEQAEQKLPILLQDYKNHLHQGRFDRAMDAMELAAAMALSSALREFRQMGKVVSPQQGAERLRQSIQPHHNRGSLKNRADEIAMELQRILAQKASAGICGRESKESLAYRWLELAASCAKVPIRYEADQIKQRQKEEQAQRGAGPVME